MPSEDSPVCAGLDQRVLELCIEIAERAGVIARCQACHEHFLRRLDNRAEVRAFAALTEACKTEALRRYRLDALTAALTAALDGTPVVCPCCAAPGRARPPM